MFGDFFFNFNLHTQAQSHHESLQIFGVCTVSFGQEILSNFCATVVIFQKKKTATSAVPKWELALWSNWKTYSFHDPQWSIAHRFPMVSIWSIDKFIDCVRRDYNYAVTLHVNSCLSQLIISRPDCYNLNPSRMKLAIPARNAYKWSTLGPCGRFHTLAYLQLAVFTVTFRYLAKS